MLATYVNQLYKAIVANFEEAGNIKKLAIERSRYFF